MRRITSSSKDIAKYEWAGLAAEVLAAFAHEFPSGYQPGRDHDHNHKFFNARMMSAFETKYQPGTITEAVPFTGMFRKEVRAYLRGRLDEERMLKTEFDEVEWLLSLEYKVEIQGEEGRRKKRRLMAEEEMTAGQ
jgi:hypothetical protein